MTEPPSLLESPLVKRRAYVLLVGIALVMGLLAVVASAKLDEPLRDPDGFLGPSWLRLPLMMLGAFIVDVVPRSIWRARRSPRTFLGQARLIIEEHWTRERIMLVTIGLASFFITYVSYRNLKNYLPRLAGDLQDPMLHRIDQLARLRPRAGRAAARRARRGCLRARPRLRLPAVPAADADLARSCGWSGRATSATATGS